MNQPPKKVKIPINGILLLNKPQGLSSNAVLQRVKHLYEAKKAGHTGSLDPLATGMLPICFGEATKFSQYLLDADKAYVATGLLGVKTNTADAMGEVIAQVDDFTVTAEALQTVCDSFLGTTLQVPSMFSALKHQGKPLYQLARAGIEVERKARSITIEQLTLDSFDGRQFQITVQCTKGTYIRNLVEDIGERLGVGAHVTQLHRLYTAGFQTEPMVTLEDLSALSKEARSERLLPLTRAIDWMPRLDVTAEQAQRLCNGLTVSMEASEYGDGPIRIYENHTRFIGLAEWVGPTVLKAKRLLSTMEPLLPPCL